MYDPQLASIQSSGTDIKKVEEVAKQTNRRDEWLRDKENIGSENHLMLFMVDDGDCKNVYEN